LPYLWNRRAQPFENLYVDFVAMLEQFKKRMKKKDQNLGLLEKFHLISTIFVVTSDPLGAAFRKFVRQFRSYSRAN
jgi:hypothetical protein